MLHRSSKYPQFSLRTMLALFAIVAVCATWARWPQHTALRFVQDPTGFRDDGLIADTNYRSDAPAILNYVRIKGRPELIGHRRSWSDLLVGRQLFSYGIWYFTVARGRIETGPLNLGRPDPRYYQDDPTPVAAAQP